MFEHINVRMTGENSPDTASIHSKRLSGMTRRQLMKVLSASGFSGFAVSHLTVEDVKAAASDQVPIVYAIAPDPDEEPSEEGASMTERVKNVPADWYDDLQHALNVHEKAQLGNRPGVVATGVSPGDYGGQNAHIDVSISQKALQQTDEGPDHIDDVRGALPETIEGVPVETANTGLPELNACTDGDCNDTDFGDYVPPGVECSGDDSGYLTLGPRMLDGGGAKYFSTNHHAFNDDGKNPYGEKIYHPAHDDPLGEVTQWDCDQDFVMAGANSDHTIQTWTGDVECIGDRFMQGQFTKGGLSDRKAAGKKLHKIGQRTCHTSGLIQNVDGYIGNINDGCSDRYKQVFWGDEEHAKAGDSGSPTYAPDPESNDYYLISSLHAGKIPAYLDPSGQGGYAFGTSAYGIKDKWGFTFG